MNNTQRDLLKILSWEMFCGEGARPEVTDELCKEADLQACYLFLHRPKDRKAVYILGNNARNLYDHQQLHSLLSGKGIPYVILKGQASAYYYPDPILRSAGDVDFLVDPDRYEETKQLLLDKGFRLMPYTNGIHETFRRKPKTELEMHKCIGTPNDALKNYFASIISEAREINGLMLPSEFHHCLMLLFHSASHLTSEGLGLRHLCDWGVFVRSVDVGRWEAELRSCGLWRFAQVLSLVCVKYLALSCQPWFGEADDRLLSNFIEDILESGNMAVKDDDRYRQVKYITNRSEGTVDKKNLLSQLWNTAAVNAKAQGTNRLKVFVDYAGLIVRGKRRPDTLSTLQSARRRKELYSELDIYKI